MNPDRRPSLHFTFSQAVVMLSILLAHAFPRDVQASQTPDCQPPQIDPTRNLVLTEWQMAPDNRVDINSTQGYFAIIYASGQLWIFKRGQTWQMVEQVALNPGDTARLDYQVPAKGSLEQFNAAMYFFGCQDLLEVNEQWAK